MMRCLWAGVKCVYASVRLASKSTGKLRLKSASIKVRPSGVNCVQMKVRPSILICINVVILYNIESHIVTIFRFNVAPLIG